MSKEGRPTKYKDEYCKQALKLCRLGSTDKDLADFFEVDERTINNWKKDHPDFFQSIKAGKEMSDAEVADRLYKRAIGYEHPEDKIFCNNGQIILETVTKYYPPDPVSAIFWLKNRQPDRWSDRHKLDANIEGSLTVEIVRFGKDNASE